MHSVTTNAVTHTYTHLPHISLSSLLCSWNTPQIDASNVAFWPNARPFLVGHNYNYDYKLLFVQWPTIFRRSFKTPKHFIQFSKNIRLSFISGRSEGKTEWFHQCSSSSILRLTKIAIFSDKQNWTNFMKKVEIFDCITIENNTFIAVNWDIMHHARWMLIKSR